MTVPSIPNTDRIADYTATASQTSFVIPWVVIADSEAAAKNDIACTVNNVAVPVGNMTFAGTSITGLSGMWNGGTLTIPACSAGQRVVISSARRPRRTGNFLEGKSLNMSEQDKLFDDFAVQMRDMDLSLKRAVLLPVSTYLDGGNPNDLATTIESDRVATVAASASAVSAAAAAAGSAALAGRYDVDTKTNAAATTIPGTYSFLRTNGYSAAGDFGGALYQGPLVSDPADGFAFLNAVSGKYWKNVSPMKMPEMIGAVGDGSTNDTTAITACENSPYTTFYLSPGKKYKTTLTVLTKRYLGDGTILLNNGSGRSAVRSSEKVTNHRIADIMAAPQTTSRPLIILGDSNEDEYGVTYGQGWPSLIRDWLRQRNGISTTSLMTSVCLGHLTIGGSTSLDASGALAQGLQMAVGANVIFVADDVDYVGVWFRRGAGLGTLSLSYTDDVGTTVVGTISTAGATADSVFALFPNAEPLRLGKAVTFQISASVNSLAINGIHARNASSPASTIFPMTCAFSGYTTANFANATRLLAIAALDPFANNPIYILPGLTNDIYHVTNYQTVAQARTNLENIIASLGTKCVLRINARPNESTLGYSSRTGEGFDAYRDMVYQLANKYTLPVLDFSEIELASQTGVYQDGLHYTALGHRIVASYVFEKLGLARGPFVPLRSAIPPTGGAIAIVDKTFPRLESIVKPHGKASLRGLFDLTNGGSFVAVNTKIGTVPAEARPVKIQTFIAATISPTGLAIFQIYPNGDLKLQYYTAVNPTYVALDGINYDLW